MVLPGKVVLRWHVLAGEGLAWEGFLERGGFAGNFAEGMERARCTTYRGKKSATTQLIRRRKKICSVGRIFSGRFGLAPMDAGNTARTTFRTRRRAGATPAARRAGAAARPRTGGRSRPFDVLARVHFRGVFFPHPVGLSRTCVRAA